jgi:hypothetical protein
MASDDEKKKATNGEMATTMATMQDAILKKMEEGFAALKVHIKALEEKAIGDGLVIKPANFQPLASSGVAATLIAPWWRGDDSVKASSLIHGNGDRNFCDQVDVGMCSK